MRIDLFGLTFDTPAATFYLWTPWRATALEHRTFEAIASLANVTVEKSGDEARVVVTDSKTWHKCLQTVSRVLKGWQEEAESGSERRAWRWMLEADVDCNGYDHSGERACLWGFIRLSLERGSPGDEEKGEDIDLNDFGLQITPAEEERLR